MPEGPTQSYVRTLVEEQGYAVLPRLTSSLSSAEVAAGLGEPVTPWPGGMVQRLIPRAVASPNTYSGNFALGSFPFHTDLAHWLHPPRYLMLRCITGYADVPTLILDGRKLRDVVQEGTLRRAIVRPRRPQAGQLRLLRLLEDQDEGEVFRWDGIFLVPASRVGIVAFAKVKSYITEASPMPVALAAKGDTLIVDNWRMLHARPSIPANRKRRCLERVYLRSLK